MSAWRYMPEASDSDSDRGLPVSDPRPEQQWLYVAELDSDRFSPTQLRQIRSAVGYRISAHSDVDAYVRAMGRISVLSLAVRLKIPASGRLVGLLHERFAERRTQADGDRDWFRVHITEIIRALLELPGDVAQHLAPQIPAALAA